MKGNMFLLALMLGIMFSAVFAEAYGVYDKKEMTKDWKTTHKIRGDIKRPNANDVYLSDNMLSEFMKWLKEKDEFSGRLNADIVSFINPETDRELTSKRLLEINNLDEFRKVARDNRNMGELIYRTSVREERDKVTRHGFRKEGMKSRNDRLDKVMIRLNAIKLRADQIRKRNFSPITIKGNLKEASTA